MNGTGQIQFIYKTNGVHIFTKSEQHIFSLPSLLSDSKEEGSANADLTMSSLIVVNFTVLGVLSSIWER